MQRPGGVACERWVLAARSASLPCRHGHEACARAVSELSKDLNIVKSVDPPTWYSPRRDSSLCCAAWSWLTNRIRGPVGKEPQQRSLTSRIHHQHSHSSPASVASATRGRPAPSHWTSRTASPASATAEHLFMCCLVGTQSIEHHGPAELETRQQRPAQLCPDHDHDHDAPRHS